MPVVDDVISLLCAALVWCSETSLRSKTGGIYTICTFCVIQVLYSGSIIVACKLGRIKKPADYNLANSIGFGVSIGAAVVLRTFVATSSAFFALAIFGFRPQDKKPMRLAAYATASALCIGAYACAHEQITLEDCFAAAAILYCLLISEDTDSTNENKWILVTCTPWSVLTVAGFCVFGSTTLPTPEDSPIGVLNGLFFFGTSVLIVYVGQAKRSATFAALVQAGSLQVWYATLIAVLAAALEEASSRKQLFGYSPFKDEQVDGGLELDGLEEESTQA
jgi:hypothetical protein